MFFRHPPLGGIAMLSCDSCSAITWDMRFRIRRTLAFAHLGARKQDKFETRIQPHAEGTTPSDPIWAHIILLLCGAHELFQFTYYLLPLKHVMSGCCSIGNTGKVWAINVNTQSFFHKRLQSWFPHVEMLLR